MTKPWKAESRTAASLEQRWLLAILTAIQLPSWMLEAVPRDMVAVKIGDEVRG
jgi:hypothetical protein